MRPQQRDESIPGFSNDFGSVSGEILICAIISAVLPLDGAGNAGFVRSE